MDSRIIKVARRIPSRINLAQVPVVATEKEEAKEKQKEEEKQEEEESQNNILKVFRARGKVPKMVKAKSSDRGQEPKTEEEIARAQYNKCVNSMSVFWVNNEAKEDEILEKADKGGQILESIRENSIYVDPEVDLLSLDEDIQCFEDAVDIYENNQQYWYNQYIMDNDYSYLEELERLEEWFLPFIEPVDLVFPGVKRSSKTKANDRREDKCCMDKKELYLHNKDILEDWSEREEHKLKHWNSIYCIPDLKDMVCVRDKKLREKITKKIEKIYKNTEIIVEDMRPDDEER